MNKTDLVAAIAGRADMTKTDVDSAIKAMMDIVMENMEKGDGEVTIPGFVSFKRIHRAARQGRNLQTGEPLTVAATDAVRIAAGSKLKAAAKAHTPPPAKKAAARKKK